MNNILFDPFYYIEGRYMKPKKGGGAPDTAPLEQATAKSIALQKKMYEQGREDMQPWYQAGAGGVGKLADLLGVSGGAVQDRDQIYQDLLPQYTQQQAGAGTGQWQGAGGQLFADQGGAQSSLDATWDSQTSQGGGRATEYMSTPVDQTDFSGLNAAVEAQLAGQGTPEGYGSLLEAFGMDKFQEDPSYQFRQEQGNKALERQMAAQGLTLGGGGMGEINPQAAQALGEYNQGLASQEYGNAYNRYGQDRNNVYNRLMGISGMGQGAAGSNVAAGQQYGQNVGNLNTGMAQAQYNAQMANQSDSGSMFGTVLGGIGGAMLGGPAGAMAGASIGGSAFSDERLKDNIELVGHKMGHNIYEFDYKDGSGRYRGVMAQEVQKTEPDAVNEHTNGYLMVDYDKLGLKMEKV